MTRTRTNSSINADKYGESEILTALYGQLTSIKKAIDVVALNRENGGISERNGKFGFKLTKQEIKTMPEIIRKIFIANNYIVIYRITSNGYYEARIRRKGMYIEASGRDFETMRQRFMLRLSDFYKQIPPRLLSKILHPLKRLKQSYLRTMQKSG